MNLNTTFSTVVRRLMFVWALGLSLNIAAQTSTLGQSGTVWKDQATIQQILNQELTETNAALALPNLTDWSSASLEAYKSLVQYAQQQVLSKSADIPAALNAAYQQMKNEAVADPTSRSWVLDDMQAKKEALLLKMFEN